MKLSFNYIIVASLLLCSCAKTVEKPQAIKQKIVIYQAVPRIFGNDNLTNKFGGTLEENGCGKMNDFTSEALGSIKCLGVTHVWYTGIIQQATKTDWSKYGVPTQNPDVVKGEAGSPYSISDYYSVSCDLAEDPAKRMEEFDSLVARTHDCGMKVIIDFIPNHVARQYETIVGDKTEQLGINDDTTVEFSPNNNFFYMPGQSLDLSAIIANSTYSEEPAKASGNDVFSNKPRVDDWYETIKLNYGVDYRDGSEHFDPIPSTWIKMSDILLYWAGKGVDGFRCDMSEMVPVEFWHYAIARVKETYPEILFVAEIYNPKSYVSYVDDGGFDYLYDKVELYDSLRAVVEGRRPASIISSVFELPTYNSLVKDHMLNFLENHDEQRIASKFFGGSPEAGRPALAVSALCNNNPFMIFYGQDLGEPSMDAEGFQGADGRTTIFDYWGLERMAALKHANYDIAGLPDSLQSIRGYYEKVMNLATTSHAVKYGTFVDLMPYNKDNETFDQNTMYAFARVSELETVIVVANFSKEEKTTTLKLDGKISDKELTATIAPQDIMVFNWRNNYRPSK